MPSNDDSAPHPQHTRRGRLPRLLSPPTTTTTTSTMHLVIAVALTVPVAAAAAGAPPSPLLPNTPTDS
ncbi:hypothetical protein R3P38DRAFT_3203779 [Favolaschia claudopus]|uniref:Uncharacterized protein n=1 Tax=Favolaschia claudopus TaxID=2862362 RepID=A0AAW0ARL5_9AGAR